MMRTLLAILLALVVTDAAAQFEIGKGKFGKKTSPRSAAEDISVLNYGLDTMRVVQSCRQSIAPADAEALLALIAARYRASGYTEKGIAASLSEIERHTPSAQWSPDLCQRALATYRE